MVTFPCNLIYTSMVTFHCNIIYTSMVTFHYNIKDSIIVTFHSDIIDILFFMASDIIDTIVLYHADIIVICQHRPRGTLGSIAERLLVHGATPEGVPWGDWPRHRPQVLILSCISFRSYSTLMTYILHWQKLFKISGSVLRLILDLLLSILLFTYFILCTYLFIYSLILSVGSQTSHWNECDPQYSHKKQINHLKCCCIIIQSISPRQRSNMVKRGKLFPILLFDFRI